MSGQEGDKNLVGKTSTLPPKALVKPSGDGKGAPTTYRLVLLLFMLLLCFLEFGVLSKFHFFQSYWPATDATYGPRHSTDHSNAFNASGNAQTRWVYKFKKNECLQKQLINLIFKILYSQWILLAELKLRHFQRGAWPKLRSQSPVLRRLLLLCPEVNKTQSN